MAAPTFVTADASTSQSTSPISHTVPSGWSVGDLVIAVIYTHIRTVSTAPDGWALEAFADFATNWYAYSKTLESGDPGTSFSWTLSAAPTGAMITFLRITGHNTSDPTDTAATGSDGSSVTTHASPILTTTQADCLLVRCMANGGVATSAVSGNTGSLDYERTSSPGLSVWNYAWSGSGTEAAAATYSTGVGRDFLYISLAIAPAAAAAAPARPWITFDAPHPCQHFE